jgi:phage terminase large subunit
LRLINCYSNRHMPISHYHDVLKAKNYQYGEWLWIPHDARAMSLQTGRSIEQQLQGLGWKTRIVPELGLVDGIQAARLTLADCHFDEKTREGIETLKQYQREYDEDKRCFKDKPRHDWTSHHADCFRYACLVWREEMRPKEPPPIRWPHEMTINELIKRQTRKRLEGA